jgi:hypothetical protein
MSNFLKIKVDFKIPLKMSWLVILALVLSI